MTRPSRLPMLVVAVVFLSLSVSHPDAVTARAAAMNIDKEHAG